MDSSLALVMQTSANALKTDLETVNVTFNFFFIDHNFKNRTAGFAFMYIFKVKM